MKNVLLLTVLVIFIGSLMILNRQSGETHLIEPIDVLKHIGSFDNLIVKVREANLSDVGYKRLMPVLDKDTSTKGMIIYRAEEATTAFDSFKGKRRLKLFIFKENNPFMRVEIVGDSPSNIEVLFATLVIN